MSNNGEKMEYTIQTLPQFEDIEKSRTNYERAKKGTDVLEKVLLDPFRQLLIKESGLPNPNEMAEDVKVIPMLAGKVEFYLQAERRFEKPSYRGIVGSWQTLLNGYDFLGTQKLSKDVVRREGKNYLEAVMLQNLFYASAVGSLKQTFELNITDLKNAQLKNEIRFSDELKFNESNLIAYLSAPAILSNLEKLKKDYTKALNAEAKKNDERTVNVTKKTSYAPTETDVEKMNWSNAVTSLITMPTKRESDFEAELEAIIDQGVPLNERLSEYGQMYDLIKSSPGGETSLYIGIGSVRNRINELLTEGTSKSKLNLAKAEERLKPLKRR